MKVIEYYTSNQQAHWLSQIEASDWGGGQYLAQLLRENRLRELVGEATLVLLLTDGDTLASFCTYAPLDEVQPTQLTPWVGFVYTFPAYRGRHCAGILLDYAESLAAIMGREAVYISTNHIGLYEHYGYEFYQLAKDVEGEDTRVYRKLLPKDGEERERLNSQGDAFKAGIVAAARHGTDPVAVCGFSCDHCFLGQWCGGCKSCFNCCSFGTLFEKRKCPNKACAENKGLEGCYACPALIDCKTGFYADGNDGANACKAQALFIRKHGKTDFLRVQDRLHEQYDFKKIQEILDDDVHAALSMLEATADTI